jgi:hypothetical protein
MQDSQGPLQLPHVFEVHAVNTGCHRRHGKDRSPAAELLDDIVLLDCRQKQARLEGGRQTLAQIVAFTTSTRSWTSRRYGLMAELLAGKSWRWSWLQLSIIGDEVEHISRKP